MATTTPTAPPARATRPPDSRAPELKVAPPPRERRPALLAAAVVLILASAAIAATLFTQADNRTEVIAVGRLVPVGRQISVTDLKRVRIATDPGLHTIPVTAAAEVVGKVAATTLLPDTLLTPEQLGPNQSPATGQAIVGLDLKGAQMPLPADRLQPGAKVRIVTTPAANGAPASGGGRAGDTGILVDQAEVFSVQAVEARETVHVAVVVDQADAPRVVRAAAVGQVGLAVLPANPTPETTSVP
jgi:hypothetical protein